VESYLPEVKRKPLKGNKRLHKGVKFELKIPECVIRVQAYDQLVIVLS